MNQSSLLGLCFGRRRLFLGQPGGWSTPTTALCARRAGALSRRKEGPLPSQSTSTLARARRGPKKRHPSATMGSPLLRHASRGAPSPTPSPRVDHGRARVPLVIACAIRICRGGVFPGCFLPSGRRPCFVGSFRSPTRVAAPAFLLEVAFSCGLGTLGTGGSCWVAPRASWTALFCLLVSYS